MVQAAVGDTLIGPPPPAARRGEGAKRRRRNGRPPGEPERGRARGPSARKSARVGAARVEAAAAGRPPDVRRRAFDRLRRDAAEIGAGDGVHQAEGVGVLRAGRRACSTGACSTMRPAYMTATRSHISATTPRSWVMSRTLMPDSCCRVAQQGQNLRLDGDVERGCRLVGDQELRPRRERHGDHDALAQTARELVRIGRVARSGFGMPTVRKSRRPHPCAAARSSFWWRRIASATCSPAVYSGLRKVIGSWKIIAMWLPRMSCISRSGTAVRSTPSNMM